MKRHYEEELAKERRKYADLVACNNTEECRRTGSDPGGISPLLHPSSAALQHQSTVATTATSSNNYNSNHHQRSVSFPASLDSSPADQSLPDVLLSPQLSSRSRSPPAATLLPARPTPPASSLVVCCEPQPLELLLDADDDRADAGVSPTSAAGSESPPNAGRVSRTALCRGTATVLYGQDLLRRASGSTSPGGRRRRGGAASSSSTAAARFGQFDVTKLHTALAEAPLPSQQQVVCSVTTPRSATATPRSPAQRSATQGSAGWSAAASTPRASSSPRSSGAATAPVGSSGGGGGDGSGSAHGGARPSPALTSAARARLQKTALARTAAAQQQEDALRTRQQMAYKKGGGGSGTRPVAVFVGRSLRVPAARKRVYTSQADAEETLPR